MKKNLKKWHLGLMVGVGVSLVVVVLVAVALVVSGVVGKTYENLTLEELERLRPSDFVTEQAADMRVAEAARYNGGIGDHVDGKQDAGVVVTVMTDYFGEDYGQIEAVLARVSEKYGDKVAIAYRTVFAEAGHYEGIGKENRNNVIMAQAVEAAGLQGYWKEMRALVLKKQNEWKMLTDSEARKKAEEYFVEVSGGRGDLEKWQKDRYGVAVAQKLAFDVARGNIVRDDGCPVVAVGDVVVWSEEGLLKEIEKRLVE